MSSFRLDRYDAAKLAEALAALTDLTRKTGVSVCAYGGIDLDVRGKGNMRVTWDAEEREYVLEPEFT